MADSVFPTIKSLISPVNHVLNSTTDIVDPVISKTINVIKFTITILFIIRSSLLRLNGGEPEFKITFVCLPVYKTNPTTHSVLRSTIPRSSKFVNPADTTFGSPPCSGNTVIAQLAEYMFSVGGSVSTTALNRAAPSAPLYLRNSFSEYRAFRLVSPSKSLLSA
ncbi:hypothetical protein AX774_g585 [Zancudomyces culisetae]|uniref:Uncharacterized protein n=1 Tax=Zancudomyces culisetae TaxID=1213189 RepID=A0A1R1PY03_ZANCU|nr:hypothetical protein AX774_g585 [Zancudomyces culisetae]|eukprot:OMH85855.1 hypothetical protein AX774_g585 [Zancudomyces culisetae]